MKDNRNNMFFPGNQPMPGMMPGMVPGMGMPGMGPGMQGFPGGPMMPNMGQMENRIASLERQVRRLDARVSRLETPYPTPTPFTGQQTTPQASFQSPESQDFTFPYQPSMHIM